MSNRGKVILILGSSGSGKGTILEYLKNKYHNFFFPISCTTRQKRINEKEGDVYNFISVGEFKEKIKKGDFLEWACVHKQNFYGTLKKPILDAFNSGKIVIREVDVQGLSSLRKIFSKQDLLSIFIKVKSWLQLKKRILKRQDMPKSELDFRHKSYIKESRWEKKCDFVVDSIEGDPLTVAKNVEKIILKNI